MKTWLLMGMLTIILVAVGGALGGRGGLTFALIIAVVMNFISYWFSDRIALRMTRSKPVEEHEAPQLYAMMRKLTYSAGLPMPRLYVSENPQPNAFATGRNPERAAVSVTQGLMRILDQPEVEGVLAHELAHIRNRDILVMSVAAVLAGAIMYVGYMARFGLTLGGGDRDRSPLALVGVIAAMILAPIAAMLVQMAISRSREYQADATGAAIAGSPNGLANALLKMEGAAQRVPMEVSPAAAHMFIVNPLSGRNVVNLFSTHPPIEKRVERLRGMAEGGNYRLYS